MVQKIPHRRWTIFFKAYKPGETGTLFFTKDLSTSDKKSEAATFASQGAAKAFAESHHLLLGGPISVGEEDFPEP